jgi:hypothetical protein
MAPRALAVSLAKVVKPALRERGATLAVLIAGWPEIAGATLADAALPERLAHARRGEPGVLHLRVEPGRAIEIQHMSAQLIERINAHLGHAAITRLRIIQAPLPVAAAKRRRAARPITAAPPRDEAVPGIEDTELSRALARLGRALDAAPR